MDITKLTQIVQDQEEELTELRNRLNKLPDRIAPPRPGNNLPPNPTRWDCLIGNDDDVPSPIWSHPRFTDFEAPPDPEDPGVGAE